MLSFYAVWDLSKNNDSHVIFIFVKSQVFPFKINYFWGFLRFLEFVSRTQKNIKSFVEKNGRGRGGAYTVTATKTYWQIRKGIRTEEKYDLSIRKLVSKFVEKVTLASFVV